LILNCVGITLQPPQTYVVNPSAHLTHKKAPDYVTPSHQFR
jgi:hypothetical protein